MDLNVRDQITKTVQENKKYLCIGLSSDFLKQITETQP